MNLILKIKIKREGEIKFVNNNGDQKLKVIYLYICD